MANILPGSGNPLLAPVAHIENSKSPRNGSALHENVRANCQRSPGGFMSPELLKLVSAARHAADAMRNMRQGRFIFATARLDQAIADVEKVCQVDICDPVIAPVADAEPHQNADLKKPV